MNTSLSYLFLTGYYGTPSKVDTLDFHYSAMLFSVLGALQTYAHAYYKLLPREPTVITNGVII
jgi:hypothetical protein